MPNLRNNNLFAIIDFETTGLSAQRGDRITEVAVVLVRNNQIVDKFQSLVNTGRSIPFDIQRLTGITNEMIKNAPLASHVIPKLYEFIRGATLVAHNAAFDKNFLKSEFTYCGINYDDHFICTLLLSRRLYQNTLDKKLQTLADYHNINRHGDAHRALSDALVTAELFIKIYKDLLDHCSESHLTVQKLISLQKKPAKEYLYTSNKLHEKKVRIASFKTSTALQPIYQSPSLSKSPPIVNKNKVNNQKEEKSGAMIFWGIIGLIIVITLYFK